MFVKERTQPSGIRNSATRAPVTRDCKYLLTSEPSNQEFETHLTEHFNCFKGDSKCLWKSKPAIRNLKPYVSRETANVCGRANPAITNSKLSHQSISYVSRETANVCGWANPLITNSKLSQPSISYVSREIANICGRANPAITNSKLSQPSISYVSRETANVCGRANPVITNSELSHQSTCYKGLQIFADEQSQQSGIRNSRHQATSFPL
ncbi:hypothetical protein AVEN_65499-1 [Araneus ventricosus]|uniref:Uncharacterized protein n=1 Tax=Araneus ventricosus TaxID=182803 RepID=A0A4Y2JJR6_ARAVE|nr:hypothetical protein AVEN_65499-1 [Araneus ventricosus]